MVDILFPFHVLGSSSDAPKYEGYIHEVSTFSLLSQVTFLLVESHLRIPASI